MSRAKVILALGVISLLKLSTAAPDSAGIVEMVNGLAYGGIPYGSVSGMLAKYPGLAANQAAAFQTRQLSAFVNPRPVFVTPNLRATRLTSVQGYAPVQIYNLPSIVAPGVVGTVSQIGY